MKQILFFLLFALSTGTFVMGQNTTQPVVTNLGDIVDKIGYPLEAKSAHVGGKVVAKVKVDEKGKVVAQEITESPSKVLSDAVLKEVPNLKFKPATQNGNATAAWVMIPFTFSLPETTAFTDLNQALASLGEVESLDLSGKGLKAVDSRLPELTSLRTLNLSNNQISAVPGSLAKLTLLEDLDLADNQLTTIPSSLKKLKNLKRLDLSGNKFSAEQVAKIRDMFEDVELMIDN